MASGCRSNCCCTRCKSSSLGSALRSQARIQAYGQGNSRERIRRVSRGLFRKLRTNRRPSPYLLIKYLSEGRKIEMALAPVAGTRLLAPFRMLVESVLANLEIEANQFEVTAQPQDTSTVADPKAQ